MKENLTSINVIIDQSGSMGHLSSETISGFNTFLEEQKAIPGEAMFSLCLFDSKYDLVYDCVSLDSVSPLCENTYKPNGYTALLDAMGKTIDSVGAKLASMNEEDRPSKVIFLIITDGQENASREYAIARIREMVSHQQDKYSWSFVFMGANIDALSEGTSLGIAAQNTYNYTPSSVGTKSLYSVASNNMTSYRASNSSKVDFFNQIVPDPNAQVILTGPTDPVDPTGTQGSNQ